VEQNSTSAYRISVKRAFSLFDRIGSLGVLFAAVACPACFPLFAAISAAVGLGALGRFEGVFFYLLQAFAVLSLIGLVASYRQHHRLAPLLTGAASVAALVYAFYDSFSYSAVYGGLFGLLGATVWNRFSARSASRALQPILRLVLTCPHCAHQHQETMPTDACMFFYDCPTCHAHLKPKPGDCCVFCSYGSVPCPPKQIEAACCA
jgi:hypothetical protein